MTSAEAAELLQILHGAYPGTYFDGAVAEQFGNSFITNDYALSKVAVTDWVANMERFPTIAELNRNIRRLRGEVAEDNVRQLPQRDERPDPAMAAAAFSRGYRQSRDRAGDDEEVIEQKLAGHLKRFPFVAGVES